MFGANRVVTDLRGVTGRQGRTERCLVLEIGNGGQDGGQDGGEAVVSCGRVEEEGWKGKGGRRKGGRGACARLHPFPSTLPLPPFQDLGPSPQLRRHLVRHYHCYFSGEKTQSYI